MPFDKSHWVNPRATIANRYEHDDISYTQHGCKAAMEAYRMLNMLPSETSQLKLLDAGCGTGRIARSLAPLFHKVVAWDPVYECIELAKRECKVPFDNIDYVTLETAIIDHNIDVAISVNVIEHLQDADAKAHLDLLKLKVKPGGKVVLWYHVLRNATVLNTWLSAEQKTADVAMGDGINVRVLTV